MSDQNQTPQTPPSCTNCKQNIDKVNSGHKWSWPKFFVGKLGNKFIAWVTITFLIRDIIKNKHLVNPSNEQLLLIIWGVVTGIFMLAGAIDAAIANAKITAEFKAGFNGASNKSTNTTG